MRTASTTSPRSGLTPYCSDNRINSDPRLVPIAKADALTDDSIAWWLEKNPNAETNASRLNFGALDEESSLVAGFKVARSRDKDSSKSFTAAMMDIRDYTVIVGIAWRV